MARGRRHRNKEVPDLDITSFLNLMVVLVPFLLITAVFSRITILQLNLPEGTGPSESDKIELTIEVIVRENRIEIGDGQQIVTVVPNTEEGQYDIERLSDLLLEIKSNYPDKRDSTVLMEPDLPYHVLVQIMDAVSTTTIEREEGSKEKIDLFPQISIGDAPGGASAARWPRGAGQEVPA